MQLNALAISFFDVLQYPARLWRVIAQCGTARHGAAHSQGFSRERDE
jgi:hypothetical protein